MWTCLWKMWTRHRLQQHSSFSRAKNPDVSGTIYRTEGGCDREVSRIANSDWLIWSRLIFRLVILCPRGTQPEIRQEWLRVSNCEAKEQAYRSVVQPVAEYSQTVWHPFTATETQQLESVLVAWYTPSHYLRTSISVNLFFFGQYLSKALQCNDYYGSRPRASISISF